MNKLIAVLFVGVVLSITGYRFFTAGPDNHTISSPDGDVSLTFTLTDDGAPRYALSYQGKPVVNPSALGFTFKNDGPLLQGFDIEAVTEDEVNETWETVWGQHRMINNHYRQLTVLLQEKTEAARQMELTFRVYNDGLGFRYHLPEQPNLGDVEIMQEHTEFRLTGDHSAWYQPCDTLPNAWEDGYNSYERLHENHPLSEVGTLMHTPVTMETTDGLFLSVHEANLTNYASMVLARGSEAHSLQSDLVPWPDGVKVKASAPLYTPWRTIQVGDGLDDLVESSLIVNLNEPNKLDDVSWIEPMKYVGVWWEMHLNRSTWEAGDNHGANTENVKRYIDFAAENGFGGVLVEGWNTGWETWTTAPNFDFTTPYPDFDLPGLAAYAQSKGVNLIGHHETSGHAATYEKHLDAAYQLMQDHGMHAVKTGYVGYIMPEGQNHHGQWMVNHYRRVLEHAAEHQVAVVAHEPIKPTGLRRTYPNMLSREAVRGMEYNAWSTGNPPDHTTILPFTMLLAGPLDYTPGIFQTDLNEFRKGNSTHTTVANQLALYVVLYSPVQMAADLPEHYAGKPAFQFIRDVPTDWEETKFLAGEIGDYVAIARQERGGDRWFVGAVSDEEAREITITLDFLNEGERYMADIYADADGAHYQTNSMAIEVRQQEVAAGQTLTLKLAPGGGQAITLSPIAKGS